MYLFVTLPALVFATTVLPLAPARFFFLAVLALSAFDIDLALAKGKSSVTISETKNHCKTNIWVIEKFLNGKFETKGNLITWRT